jgi:phosphoserine phosphatase
MKAIVAFDLNKTLIKENSWYDFNLAMGITSQEDEFLFRLGPEGEGVLTYKEWIDILVRLMRKRGKANRADVENVIMNFNYLDGAKNVTEELKRMGYKTGLITGAFTSLAEKVTADLTLDFVYCNSEIQYDENGLIKNIEVKDEDFLFKVKAVEMLKQQFPDHEIYYVADGDNDAEIFKITKGIIIDPKSIKHEDWKHLSIEKGEKFSHSLSYAEAWQIVGSLSEVPEILTQNDDL